MFKFFIENELISPNQSRFKPGYSCTNQLLTITHEIYKSFDEGFEIRGVFLDISMAFDKVWHEGLIFKLKQNGISGNLINLLCNFLKNRKQRVSLNGQVSGWSDVKAGVPQGSILSPLLFLIYINDLSEGLSSNAELLAYDTSLFSVIHDSNTSTLELNNDVAKINRWAFKWKMSFNPDPKNQALEVIFSRKSKATSHPPLVFNNNNVMQAASQKNLGIILDTRLSFEKHLETVLCKINKTMGLIRKLQNLLPISALITLYKGFVRPHLDYGDIIYDQARNESFHLKLESIQYHSCLAITGAIRGSSTEKLYQELGFESLQQRRWYRKLCCLYKIIKNKSPRCLFNIIPARNPFYITRNHTNILLFKTNHIFLKSSFFPSTIIEWNNLEPRLRTYGTFKNTILKFLRPSPNSVFKCHNPQGIKFLTRLRLGLSHLREHKFKHSFQDSLNPLCKCGFDVKSTSHFLLHCPI